MKLLSESVATFVHEFLAGNGDPIGQDDLRSVPNGQMEVLWLNRHADGLSLSGVVLLVLTAVAFVRLLMACHPRATS